MPQWDSHPRCHRRPGTKPARNDAQCGLVVVDLVVSCPSSFRFNHQSYHSIGQKLHCTSQLGHFNNAQPSAGLVASASASTVVRFRRRPHQQQPMETSWGKKPRCFRNVKYCCQRHHQKTHLFFQKTPSGKVYHRNPHVSVHLALRHETWCKQKSLRFLFWSPSFENFAWSLAPVAEYISQLGPSTSSATLVMSDLQRCWISIQYLSIRQQPYLNKQKTFRFYDPIPISFSMGTKISKVHAIQRPRTLRDLNDLDYPGAPKKR